MSRILGIDYGERRVGLAVSDPSHIIAQPLTTIIRKDSESWWDRLAAIIAEQEVEAVVVGYPRTLRGTSSRQTEVVDRFITRLRERESLPIYPYDERLTSVAARKALQQQGIKTGHRKEAVDRTAAALLLQDYLDSQR